MEVEINWVAVVLAAVASMAVGFVWYAKPVFGKMWMDMVGLDDKKANEGAGKAMAMCAVAALLTAYVLAHVTYLSNAFFTGNSWFQNAVTTAFWLGLGISATSLVIHYAFEQRSQKLVWLNVANQIVSFLAMGAVIGLLRP